VAAVRLMRTVNHDERGLMGKILVLWLVLGILLALAAIDTAQILYARYKVADAAQTASFEAASTLRTTRGDRRAAYDAAVVAVTEVDGDARMKDFLIDTASGEVSVTVTKKVSTLLVGRFGLLEELKRATATETSSLSGP
jgi:Flp pilus assembly protein TadG